MKIKTSLQPQIPWKPWVIHSHNPVGEFDIDKVILYGAKTEKLSKLPGSILIKKISDKKPLDASVLDYLFLNKHLIPGSWENKHIYFFGTIFTTGTIQYVRSIYCKNNNWYLGIGDQIDADFPDDRYAAFIV